MKFELPTLSYPYGSLEPYIDEMTMTIHHTKHHAGYVNNLNLALAKFPNLPDQSLAELLMNLEKLPKEIQTAIRNNGGGHYNHSLFFSALKINNGELPKGALLAQIEQDFGSYANFKTAFTEAAKSRFGSGWAWLIAVDGHLEVVSTPNQDTPLLQGTPLLGLDVWEHAYYLRYQNRRPEYIENFFQIIDWNIIEQRWTEAQK